MDRNSLTLTRAVTIAIAVSAFALLLFGGTAVAQGLPPMPAIYSGTATAAGSAAPDGLQIVARVDGYQSEPVTVSNGRYNGLTVAPPEAAYVGKTVTFHLNGVKADQEITFQSGNINLSYPLTFPGLPEPTPTPTPVSTSTPVPSPTPHVALPAIYSGLIVVAGGSVPTDATLVARVGYYESVPALIEGGSYRNLVVDPRDTALIGRNVEFILNGTRARTSDIYRSGGTKTDFDLVFVGLPTPTPSPTPRPTTTAVPPTPRPTATAVPPTTVPTATAVPPTPRPTATAVPPTPMPTATAVPPTPQPTATVVPPTPVPTAITVATTATPQPTQTPASSGGGCLAAGDGSITAGLSNILLLIAPLGFVAGYRRLWRPNRRIRG